MIFLSPGSLYYWNFKFSFIEHTRINTGDFPFVKHEQKSQTPLDGYGTNKFMSVNYFLLTGLVPQPHNWGKLPSVVSRLPVGLARAVPHFLFRKFFPFNQRLQFSPCSLVAVIYSLIFAILSLRLCTSAPGTFFIPEHSLTFPVAEFSFIQIMNLGWPLVVCENPPRF